MIRLQPGDRALFASDVHMGAHAPGTAEAFLGELEAHAPDASHLFLLGDLFEAWVGDDWVDQVSGPAISRIAALSAAGLRVFVMRGNRDFLLDVDPPSPCRCKRFSERTGATMIDDPVVIDLFGERTLLAHGDALCTGDTDYQRFRALTRDAAWQRAFLARPLDERIAIAQDLRARSELSKGEKAEALMDVAAQAVEAAMAAAGARVLIHGHTHRPARHALLVEGEPAQRWVLPDWDAAEGRGGLLRASASGLEPIGAWRDAVSPPSG